MVERLQESVKELQNSIAESGFGCDLVDRFVEEMHTDFHVAFVVRLNVCHWKGVEPPLMGPYGGLALYLVTHETRQLDTYPEVQVSKR